MADVQIKHPTAEQLHAFILGKLSLAEHDQVEEHVSDCDTCCDQLKSIPDDTLIDRVKNADTPITETMAMVGDVAKRNSGEDVPASLANHSRYRVVRQLGRGGMGTVFEAEHRMMGRTVALKVINHQFVRNRMAIERFRGEVRAAAQLSHPNIVTAHDADEAGHLHFLVMEFVDGTNLAKQVEKSGPLPIRHACHFARQVALGLQHAHEQGMVHRDIKPQNLMLTRQGRVKILDFGLARFASEANADSESAKLTKAGVTLGTPDYMAPEQVLDSRKADIRADIYSLGCTLYFMLTGKPPFSEGSAIDKMKAHLQQTPSAIAGTRDDMPTELAAIINRMMAKDVSVRFGTPGEVAAVLQPFCQSQSTTTPPVAPPVNIPVSAVDSDPLGLGDGMFPNLPPLPKPATNLKRVNGPATRNALQAAGAISAFAALAFGAWVLFDGFLGGGQRGVGEESQLQAPSTPGISPNVADAARILIVLPFRDFWGPDYYGVREALDAAGARVDVASSQRGQATASENGGTVGVDMLLSDANPDQYDAVIFSGAYPASSLEFLHSNHDQAKRLIDAMLKRNKHVTAICVGNAVLAKSGVLDGHSAAANEYLPPEARAISAIAWSERQPTQSFDRIITARADKDSQPFVRELLDAIQSDR